MPEPLDKFVIDIVSVWLFGSEWPGNEYAVSVYINV